MAEHRHAPRQRVEDAILDARQSLEDALSDLARLPAGDLQNVAYGTHTIHNLPTVTGSTLDILARRLSEHQDPIVLVALQGLLHANELMAYAVDYVNSGQTARTIEMRLESIEVQGILQRACDYYQGQAERKGIALVPRLIVDVPPVVMDRVLLEVVIHSFLSNAVKYSAPGGRIFVDLFREEGAVVCSVRDEGPGLSPEDQVQLFQRGVTLTPRPTGGERSIGFGLALANELPAYMGAVVGADSELGRGSRFHISLPVEDEPPPGGQTAQALIPWVLAGHAPELACQLV
jgi:signal transduction histidine kinase